MTDTTAIERFISDYRAAMEASDMARAAELLTANAGPDFTVEWPQSGERIRGVDNYRRLNERYAEATGTQPALSIRSIQHCGDLVLGQGTIDYGDGVPVSFVSIMEWRDGKIARETEYFANPFEAPDWRAGYVERM